MNARLVELVNTVLSDSERRELGLLLELDPASRKPRQRAREFDLLTRLMSRGLETFPWTWQDFEYLTPSGHVPLLPTGTE